MGLNTLFAGLCVAACGADHRCHLERAEDALDMASTTTFLMGFVLLLFSILNATNLVLLFVPTALKTAIMVGIGAFQAFVGLRWMQVIRPAGQSLLQLEAVGDGGLDFSNLCREEGCFFMLCPPANDRWHPWPFFRRLYDAAVHLQTEYVIMLEPDNTIHGPIKERPEHDAGGCPSVGRKIKCANMIMTAMAC